MVELRSGRTVQDEARTVSPRRSRKSATVQLHVVTGGGGYAGFRLGLALLKEGHQVKLLDVREPSDSLLCGITFQKVDIRDYASVEKALPGAFCVYHMASYGMSGREQLNRKLIEEVNITGTENILKACKVLDIHHLVYTSTYNVVFGGQVIENGDERLPYLPLDKHPDHYSRTKSIADMCILKADGTQTDDGGVLHTCCLRLAGVYGPGEQRHLPRIVTYIQNGLFKTTVGEKSSLVEFLHVDNLVQAHIKAGKALTESHSHIASGQSYFISDCKPVNNFEFFRPLVEGLGYTYPKLVLPVTLVYYVAFLIEIVHSVIGRVYNFQPLLTRTEVYKTGVTHYFSNAKAQKDLEYFPTKQNDMECVVKWYLDRGYHRSKKRSSALVSLLRDVAVALIFAAIILSLLPVVS